MERLRSINVALAIIIALLVGQSSTRPRPDEIEDMKNALNAACSVKYPITDEMRNAAKTGTLSDDRTFKCYIMCTFDELSLVDVDEGEIDGETLISMMPDELKDAVTDTVKTCLPNIAGKPDACEVTYNLLSCGIKMNSKLLAMLPF